MAVVQESPLWALIRRAKEDRGLSYREIATKSRGTLRRTDLDKYRLNTLRFIVPEKMVAISEVFEVPLREVVQAALATMGLDDGGAVSIEDAIRGDDSLPELLKRRLLRLIEDHRRGVVQEAAYRGDGDDESRR